MNPLAGGWRLATPSDDGALRILLEPREVHATALAEKVRTPRPFRNGGDRILVHPCGKDCINAVLFLSSSGCAMPLVDSSLGSVGTQSVLEGLRRTHPVPAFRPASCVGLESTTQSLQTVLGWKPSLSVQYDAMSLDARDFTPRPSPAQVCRTAGPEDLEALLPVARAYELEEVATSMHLFEEAVCRANQARALARYRVMILERDGRIVARAQTNAIGYGREQLGGIIVLPQLRGHGYGRLVVSELAASILGEGKGLSLFVKKVNIPARSLYESLGFVYSGDFRVDYFK